MWMLGKMIGEKLSISIMGALCPEWEHYVQNGSLTQESPKMVFVFVFWHSVSVMFINDATTAQPHL